MEKSKNIKPLENNKLLEDKKLEDISKENKKRVIRLFLAISFLLIGLIFSLFPFLPFGYFFLILGLFFLSSFIPPLDKFLRRIEERDKKKRISRARKKSGEIEDKIIKRVKLDKIKQEK
jgi:sensor histidine kinase YesM